MSTDIIHFRHYAQEVLNERFPDSKVTIDELSLHERQGYFYYRIYTWIDGKLCIGIESSQGKALDAVISSFANYNPKYERITV